MPVFIDQIDEKIAQFSISHFLVNPVENSQMTEQFHKATKVYTLYSGLNAMYVCANALCELLWRDESVFASANSGLVGSISENMK